MRTLCPFMFVLCLVLCFALPSLGETDFDPDTGTLKAWGQEGTEAVLPAQIGGVALRKLGPALFDQRTDLTAATVPEGITHIGGSAFYLCSSLRQIELPQSLEAIGDAAFFSCSSLSEVTIPARVQVIGKQAFAFTEGLRSLRFEGRLPKYLAPDAFEDIANLKELVVTVPAGEEAAYEAALGVPCVAGPAAEAIDFTAPEAELQFDAATGTISGWTGRGAVAAFPAQIDGVPVTRIGDKALFANQDLMVLELPESITAIGQNAFAASVLVDIALPEGLKAIGQDAFFGVLLKRLTLPASLTDLGERAFGGAHLTSLRILEGITTLPKDAFFNNLFLTELYLPASLDSIGEGAFSNCSSLAYVVMGGETLPRMAADAFKDCPIEDVDIAHTASKAQEDEAKAALAAMGI